MKELLKAYREITEAIFLAFGIENGYGDIDDKTDVKWDATDDSVHWLEEDEIYSNDVLRGPAQFENFVLYYIDNSAGDEFYQIFDRNLRDSELED
jgi:hypothetical protein